MLNNIVFEYVPKSKVCHDDTLTQHDAQSVNRFFISSVISMLLSVVFAIGYIILPSTILLCAMTFCIVFFIISVKYLESAHNDRMDIILTATETDMTMITYDKKSNNMLDENTIDYSRIYKSYFTDKECTSLVIILNDGTHMKYYVQKYSPPQYFFLYRADEYFTMSKPTADKILKQYGSEKQYKKVMMRLYADEVTIKS